MGTLLQDLRYAARTLGKSKGYTAVAILTLTLGIGATSTIFTALNAIVLRPFPYPGATRLVHIYSVNPGFKSMHINMALGDLPDVRTRTHSFETIAAYQGWMANLTGEGEPVQLIATKVSHEFFDLLGQRPERGRFFVEGENQPGRGDIVVLSDALWRGRFGADEKVLGKRLVLDGTSYTVVGVAAPGFRFPADVSDVWTPLAPAAAEQAGRSKRWCSVLARMRRGVSLEQANADVATLSAALAKEFPDTNKDWTFTTQSLQDEIVGDIRDPLFVLFAGVIFLLLIGCANIANLSLARNWSRRRATAICAALGASRGRIIRQVLVESGIVALCGGGAGVALAVWGLDVIRVLAPQDTPRLEQLRPDWTLLAFTAGCSAIAGMFFGLAPALQSAGVDINRTLRSDERFGGGFARGLRRWFTGALVAAEVALTIVLLIGSGLMIESFARLTKAQTGLRTERILSLSMLLPKSKYPDGERQSLFVREALARIEGLPNVESAAATSSPILQGFQGIAWGIHAKGEFDRPEGYANLEILQVTPEYFDTFAVPIRAGRAFTNADRLGSPRVAIVNETMARLVWGNSNPIGQQFSMRGAEQPKWHEVVGMAADTRDVHPDEAPRPEFYTPLLQDPGQIVNMAIRTSSDPLAIVPAVRGAIWSVDKDEPITDVQTVEAAVARYETAPRFRTILLTVFAGLGLALAIVGVYGVVSYATAQRTHEIGVRSALGARPAQILRQVLLRGMTPVLLGAGAGLVAALFLGKLLENLLFEVKPTEPLALAGGAILVVVVSLISCYIPARRATRVDPLVALRYE
jgi:putative ABC transport system permease protein